MVKKRQLEAKAKPADPPGIAEAVRKGLEERARKSKKAKASKDAVSGSSSEAPREQEVAERQEQQAEAEGPISVSLGQEGREAQGREG